ncbi:MAG TPA: transcriptional repressor [Candidatus Nanoarchaeia archaeon]|nr:transcriptional repressor [Candidatus Nanoarchaeia archaeon]
MPKTSRQTKQKNILQEQIKSFESFFTAEDLHRKAKKQDPKVGIATIYRYLKDLTLKHQLHSYTCDRKSIYSRSERSHCHFVCQKCRLASHIDIHSIDFLKSKIKGTICHFQIDVEGVCERCK